MSTHLRLNKPAVVFQKMEGEAVVVNLDNGNYYSLNHAATAIVETLESSQSVESLLAQLSECCDAITAELQQAVTCLIEGMKQEGILVAAEAPRSEAAAPEFDYRTHAMPAFEAFTDMQEFLLLDPIHDVGAQGWPRRAEDAQSSEAVAEKAPDSDPEKPSSY